MSKRYVFLTEDQKKRIFKLSEQGVPKRIIAERFNVCYDTILRMIREEKKKCM